MSNAAVGNAGFEPLVAQIDIPVDRQLVSGSGVFSCWVGPFPSIYCRLKFEQKINDSLLRARYHHQLASILGDESERRKAAGGCQFGGGMIKINEGEVSVCWMGSEHAAEVMDDDLYLSIITDLRSRYLDILSDFDLVKIYSSPGLSGVFLPMPSRAYVSSRRKVFVIGQEAKSWRDSSCGAKLNTTVSLEDVEKSMTHTLEVNKRKPGRVKFRQFYKRASSELSAESLDPSNAALWSNQFCISYNKGSPVNSPQFSEIKAMSYELLRAQFDILKPDVAIFTVGANRDRFIKECFDYADSEVIEKERLWYFKVGGTRCFRTNHPRSWRSAPYLEDAIALAKRNT